MSVGIQSLVVSVSQLYMSRSLVSVGIQSLVVYVGIKRYVASVS